MYPKKIDTYAMRHGATVSNTWTEEGYNQAISEMTSELLARTEVGVFSHLISEKIYDHNDQVSSTWVNEVSNAIALAIQSHIRQGLEGKV